MEYKNLKDAIAKRIKEILHERNLSQYALYKLSGVPQSTISTILNGNIKTVTIGTIFDICSSLNIELTDFFNNNLFNIENLKD